MTDEPQGGGQPTEEELRAALEEQMKRITVKDVLLQTVITLINVSARKLGLAGEDGEKDLAQAKLGIDGVRALVPLLPDEEQNAVREPLSQLQMAFAREAGGSPTGERSDAGGRGSEGESSPGGEEPEAGGRGSEGETPEDPTPDTQSPAPADPERAKARSKIWTPPGT